MLRVAFVTILPSPYQVDLFRALARRPEVDLSVFYMEEEAPDSPWPKSERQAYERIMPGFWRSFGGARFHVNWGLPKPGRFDAVVLSSYMSTTGQYLMRRKLKGTPWLYWGERMREQTGAWKRSVQDILAAPLEQAAGIVGIGSLAEASYRRRFTGTRHHCIPYYTDLEPFTAMAATAKRWEDSELRFFCCGQMIARKGIDLLLQAFDRLIGGGVSARLILVGREAELPQMLSAMSEGGRQQVEYRGFHAPEMLPADFAGADVFVLPSRYDGWGVVVNQALGAGLPIICSDAVGAAHDLIEPGVNGLMVESGSADAIYQAMRRVVEDRDALPEWGRASLEMSRDCSPEIGAERWVNVLESTVEG